MQKFGEDGRYKEQIQRSLKFVIDMQNSDGGFPAFDKGLNEDNYLFILGFKLSKLDNSAEIFDPSCPDITGHFLEAIGHSKNLSAAQKASIKESIQYLKDSQW